MRGALQSVVLIGAVAACGFEVNGGTAIGDARVDGASDASSDGRAIDATVSSCPPSYTHVLGASRYALRSGTWYAGQAACAAEGAHLVVINDAAENAFVLSIDPDGDVWMGFSDHAVEGTFAWITGAALTSGYQNWQFSQPNNSGGQEDCGEMNAGGVWNDSSCDFPQNYICECDGVTPPVTPTWCETGTDANCDSCSDACDSDEECSGSQQCIED